MSYTTGNPYGQNPNGQAANAQSGYVQPQFGQGAGNWTAPGAVGGARPWDLGPGGVPLAPMQQAPQPRKSGTPAVMPLAGQTYASAFRPLPKRWGRFLLGLGIALGMFLLSQAPSTILVFFLLADAPMTALTDPNQLMSLLMTSDWLLVVTNIGWGIMIAGSIATMAIYGPGAWKYLLSVAGKWRWGLTLKALGLFAGPFAIYIGFTLMVEEGLTWQFDPNWLLVFSVLLLTPLQATGEEFLFRGVLTQKIGGWIPHQIVAALVSGGVTGFIFGAIHGHGFSLATLQLMCVGWVCSLLTHRTGGLEAASALHTLNNMFIMLPLAFMGVSALDPTMGGAAGVQSPLIVLASFGLAMFALGSSYALAHFFLKKEQRVTVGAPGAEALLAPAYAVAFGGPAGYAGAPRPAAGGVSNPMGGYGAGGQQYGGQPGAQQFGGQPGYAPPASAAAPTYAPPPSAVAPSQHNPYAPRPQGGAPVGTAPVGSAPAGSAPAADGQSYGGARDGAFTTREPFAQPGSEQRDDAGQQSNRGHWQPPTN